MRHHDIKYAPFHPLSSAAERRTHNPEVGGSKPPGGILQFVCFTETDRLDADVKRISSNWTLNVVTLYFTGMAQRKRAGLITPRSHDRNVLPVFSSLHPVFKTLRNVSGSVTKNRVVNGLIEYM